MNEYDLKYLLIYKRIFKLMFTLIKLTGARLKRVRIIVISMSKIWLF